MCGHERKQKDFRHAIFFEGCLHMVCMWGGGSLGVFPAHFLRTIQYFLIKFWTDFPGITRMVTILKIPRHALSLRGRLVMLINFLRTIQYFHIKYCWDEMFLFLVLSDCHSHSAKNLFEGVFVSFCRGSPFWGILGGIFLYFLSNLQYFVIRFYIDVTGTTLKHFSKHAPLCCGLFWDIFHELSWYYIRKSMECHHLLGDHFGAFLAILSYFGLILETL